MINKILGCQQINKSIINSYPKFGVSSKIIPSSNGYTMLWVEVESVYSNINTSAIWPQPNIPNWFSIGITTVEHSSMVVLLLTVKEPSIMDVPSPKYVYQRLYHRFWPLVDISIYLITYSNSERPRFILYSCHLVHSSCTELFQDRGPNKVVDSHIQKKSLLRLRWKKNPGWGIETQRSDTPTSWPSNPFPLWIRPTTKTASQLVQQTQQQGTSRCFDCRFLAEKCSMDFILGKHGNIWWNTCKELVNWGRAMILRMNTINLPEAFRNYFNQTWPWKKERSQR